MKIISRSASFYTLVEKHVHGGEKLTRQQIYRKKKKKNNQKMNMVAENCECYLEGYELA